MPRKTSPAKLGYRWPAEWEPHAATWLAWPHNRQTWPGKFESIPRQFARLVRTIARFEPVHLLAGGVEPMAAARQFVGNVANVTLHDIETDDAWTRDHGPTFVQPRGGGDAAIVNWKYNAWGGKYPPWDLDNAVPTKIADLHSRKCFAANLVLEGGAIDGNGRGLLLTTSGCLLDERRNPGLGRDEVERALKDHLAVEKVLWLHCDGIAGDDTDGHIDQLARFVGNRTVVVAREDDPHDHNFEPLADLLRQLEAITDERGQPLEMIPLPMPRPLYFQGKRLPASYLNFYILNGAVIVPQFNDPADEIAIATLGTLFPDREIIGMEAVDLVWGLGAFHCLTQQETV